MHQILGGWAREAPRDHILEMTVMSNEIEGHFDVVVLGSGDEGSLGPGMVFGFLAGRQALAPLQQA